MNATITRNNLQIFYNKLEGNSKLNEEWLTYKSFLNDGIKMIELCVKELNNKDKVISLNFREDATKVIEYQQAKIKVGRLEDENKRLKQQLKEMELKIDKVLNNF